MQPIGCDETAAGAVRGGAGGEPLLAGRGDAVEGLVLEEGWGLQLWLTS